VGRAARRSGKGLEAGERAFVHRAGLNERSFTRLNVPGRSADGYVASYTLSGRVSLRVDHGTGDEDVLLDRALLDRRILDARELRSRQRESIGRYSHVQHASTVYP
jgi:hypothetical protein